MQKELIQTGGKMKAIRERVESQPNLDVSPDQDANSADRDAAEQTLLTQRLQEQYGHDQVTDAISGEDTSPMGTLILAEWALGTAGLDSLVDGEGGSAQQVFSTLHSDDWAATSAAVLSRHETSNQPGHAHLAAELIRRSRGQRLPADVAARLSAALGADISDAVIHTDSAAAQAAAAVNAHAFATGKDVFFGQNKYRPGTREGDELLAHELTHVVQDAEGRIPAASGQGLTVSSPTDSHEREAETVAHEAMDMLYGTTAGLGDVGLDAPDHAEQTEALASTGTASLLSRDEDQSYPGLHSLATDARDLMDPELWILLFSNVPVSTEERQRLRDEQMEHSDSNLSTEEVARVRELIPEHLELMGDMGCSEAEIESERAWLYQALSTRTAYLSQRNNDQGQGINDVMCNLTTLANVLIHNGVRNPDPMRQLEDVLEERLGELVAAGEATNRYTWNDWPKLASELGLELTDYLNPGKATNSAEELELFCLDTVRPILERGGSVIAGINQGKANQADTQATDKGHIIRVKWVREDGVIIDDPYGNWANEQGDIRRWYWSANSNLWRISFDRNEGAQETTDQGVQSADQSDGFGDPGIGADMFVNWEAAHQVKMFKNWMHTK